MKIFYNFLLFDDFHFAETPIPSLSQCCKSGFSYSRLLFSFHKLLMFIISALAFSAKHADGIHGDLSQTSSSIFDVASGAVFNHNQPAEAFINCIEPS